MVLSAKCGGQIGTQSLLKAVIEGLSQTKRKYQVNFGRRQKGRFAQGEEYKSESA